MGFSVTDLAKGDEISKAEEVKYREIFKANDVNKNDQIDTKELLTVLNKCGAQFTAEGADLVMRFVDLDGSHTLSENEFIYVLGFVLKSKVAFVKATGDKAKALDRKGLEPLLKECGYAFSSAQVAALYPMVDQNNSNTIELNEFITLAVFLRFVRIHFILADLNKDGKLDLAEVHGHLPALGLKCDESVSKRLFERIDMDKSGDISFEEFAILCAMIKLETKPAAAKPAAGVPSSSVAAGGKKK